MTVNGRLLVDGMLAHSLPSQPVRDMGADRVLAVNLKGRWTSGDGPRHIFDVIGQCFSIAQKMNCEQSRQCADLIIEPDVTGYRYDDFEHSPELVKIGEADFDPGFASYSLRCSIFPIFHFLIFGRW